MKKIWIAGAMLVAVIGVLAVSRAFPSTQSSSEKSGPFKPVDEAAIPGAKPDAAPETAIFAGGCFWSMTAALEKVPGVRDAVAGYIGGQGDHPTYDDYAEHGFVEAVQVTYNPTAVSYRDLLDAYWRNTDPTDGGGQFVDRGPQYRPIVYYMNAGQKLEAEISQKALAASGRFDKPIATQIAAATAFTPAEDYHQHYADKNPMQYDLYHEGSGRDHFFKKTWDPAETQALLKKKLTPEQFDVTQHEGTEPPFQNAYWNNEKPGIYVDVIDGRPLFSSTDKFDSGTGWPSFTRPLVPRYIAEKKDTSLLEVRTEVRTKYSDAHLGHVFDDGPAPTHLRYCMNSAALRFIPKEDLAKEGYGEYAKLFK